MAEVADNILKEIQAEAIQHERARQMDAKALQALAEVDAVEAAKMADHGAKQSGIENQLAKAQQEAQDKATAIATAAGVVARGQLDKEGEGLKPGEKKSTEEGQEKGSKLTEQIVDKLVQTFKETRKVWKEQFHATMTEQAQFKNFTSALKTDFQLVQGKMQLLTNLPGMQTLMAGLKFVFARLLLWFMGTKFGKKLLGKDSPLGKWLAGPLEKLVESAKETADVKKQEADKDAQADLETGGEGYVTDYDPTQNKGTVDTDRPGLPSPETFSIKEEANAAKLESARVAKEEAKETEETTIETSKANRGFNFSLKAMNFQFIKDAIKKVKGTAFFKVASSMFNKALTAVSAALTAAAVGMGIATAPIWGIVAVFALIAIAFIAYVVALGFLIAWLWSNKDAIIQWFKDTWDKFSTWFKEMWDGLVESAKIKWDEFSTWFKEKWDSIVEGAKTKWGNFKQLMSDGWDRIVEIADTIKNWFSDTATGIGLKIKHMIAVITDGIAHVVNSIIDGISAKFPRLAKLANIDKYKLETGAVEGVAIQQAEFDAKVQNRELIAAQKRVEEGQDETRFQERRRLKAEGGNSASVVNINKQDRQSIIIEKTSSSDAYANAINNALMGI